MSTLADVAPAFIEMAHRIVWCIVATVDTKGRPRTRVLHPIWEWDGDSLVGWIATGATSPKAAHLEHTPLVSLTYWATNQDTCSADCDAEMLSDDATSILVWDKLKHAPAPVGYDPAIIPPWADGPTSPAFGAMRLVPTSLRVLPQMNPANLLTWRL